MSTLWLWHFFFPFTSQLSVLSEGNPDAKRLYDDIMSGYNKLVSLSILAGPRPRYQIKKVGKSLALSGGGAGEGVFGNLTF